MNQRLSEDNWDWRKKNDILREQLRVMTEKYDNLVISSREALEGEHTNNTALTNRSLLIIAISTGNDANIHD